MKEFPAAMSADRQISEMTPERNKVVSELLNELQSARFLNCSVSLLRKWRRVGGGPPYVHLGKLVRYPVAELRIWVATRGPEVKPIAAADVVRARDKKE